MDRYLLAGKTMPWYAMALSIMATQASAITFISTTGQSYVDGMRFVQFYFGLPIAMIVICATVVPVFHRARVYTAYEYLEKRFDAKTRALASVIFLCQRGLSAGLTIYAPAIVLTAILGWPERATTLVMGGVVVAYTVLGGIKAVTWSDVQQMCVIFLGLLVVAGDGDRAAAPFGFLRRRGLPGGRGRPPERRHHQFRLERPLQPLERTARRHVSVSLLFRMRPVPGAALFDRPVHRREPVEPAVQRRGQDSDAGVHPVHRRHGVRVLRVRAAARAVPGIGARSASRRPAGYAAMAGDYQRAFERRRDAALGPACSAPRPRFRRPGSGHCRNTAPRKRIWTPPRQRASQLVELSGGEKGFSDTNYIFLTFVTRYLPVGIVGLVIAVILAATMSASSGEINSLATVTVVDIYKRYVRRDATDHHYLKASRWATLFWGVYAVAFAGFAGRLGPLIVAVNKVGSLILRHAARLLRAGARFPPRARHGRIRGHAGGRSRHPGDRGLHRRLLAVVQRHRLRGGGRHGAAHRPLSLPGTARQLAARGAITTKSAACRNRPASSGTVWRRRASPSLPPPRTAAAPLV